MISARALERASYDQASLPPDEAAPVRCGCRALLWATLSELFTSRNLHRKKSKHVGEHHKRRQRQHEDDARWLASAVDVPFSLVWICQHLGIDPNEVRVAYHNGVGVPHRRSVRSLNGMAA
jgi:hypothetical protein